MLVPTVTFVFAACVRYTQSPCHGGSKPPPYITLLRPYKWVWAKPTRNSSFLIPNS